MPEEKAICTLDYLVGTFATAYKGLITSLVIKDFCMVERSGLTIFKGTIFSLPEGNYQASLMHEGIEISRSELRDGYFELKADSGLIADARNLQIDIVQTGRHLGTFLLKRGKKEGYFISALELSEEIKDINFGILTAPLRGKVGLLKKSEDIIAAILSTKQNWKRLSEQINTFSKDLFWYDRAAYYTWFDVLLRWSLSACNRIESDALSKAASNVLSLIELPLESESDRERLYPLVKTWINRIIESPADLSAALLHCRKALSLIHETFPDVDIKQALTVLLRLTIDRVKKTPALAEDVLGKIKDIVTSGDYVLLGDYSESRRKQLLEILSDALVSLREDKFAGAFEALDSAYSWLSKDRDMATVFFDVIDRNVTRDSAEVLSDASSGLLGIFPTLPPDIYGRAVDNTVRHMKKLVELSRADVCSTFLTRVEQYGERLKTDIILKADAASAILQSADDELLKHYNRLLEKIMIPAPGISGFSRETWAEIANPLHLERLTKFLEILRLGSGSFREILIRVICNIYVSGVFIPDDRIFQRDISKYLNSGVMKEYFLLHYVLLKKLPVYYHEVGATGRLRDYTTEIDSWGNDPVLYFLRKQVHVNSSNYLIHLIEEVMKAWEYKDPDILKGFVPEDILRSTNVALIESYSSVIRPFFESSGILDANGFHFEKILELSDDEIDLRLRSQIASDEIRLKIFLLCRIYRELVKKYSLLSAKVEREDIVPKIIESAGKLKDLKTVVVSPEKTQPEESLYFKRHIAFGIPSVMGSYHEPKFDALGEMLEAEERMRTFFDVITAGIRTGEPVFSKKEISEWIACLDALSRILHLHDLGNFQVDEAVVILRENNLCLSQIMDLLRMCQKEMTRMVEFLTKTFQRPLADVLENFPKEELSEYLRGVDPKESDFVSKAADIVMRAIMGGIVGFFEFDALINNLVYALNLRLTSQSDELVNLVDEPAPADDYFTVDGLSDVDAMRLSPLIGNKTKNLIYLCNNGLPIPQAVVFRADRTLDYSEYTESSGFMTVLRNAVKYIEEKTGRVFGGKNRPLFLSVRSGAYISMPGILSSIIYCGMNPETVDAFIADTGDPLLAWDSYRRFIEHYSMVVYDLDISVFENIVDDFLEKHGEMKREDLGADQMAEVVRLYQMKLKQLNLETPRDVFEQLKESVKAVYRSWYSERSLQFRGAMAISEHWGTSVMLMQMVHGNAVDSGASVFFTRKPVSLAAGIYGDTKERATGGELVYGRSVNRPITREQAFEGQKSLEEIDPELFRMHEELAQRIENSMRGLPQEVEATYTKTPQGKKIIYVIQTRNMEFYRGFLRRFDDVCNMGSKVVGQGVGVHGGALSGVAAFTSSPERVRMLREKTGLPVILLRREASTDDVSLMPEINGILTAAGGATSHAAVLAQKFRLTAIVGCSEMKIEAAGKNEFSAKIGTLTLREGDFISIDGSTGLVHSGLCFSATEIAH